MILFVWTMLERWLCLLYMRALVYGGESGKGLTTIYLCTSSNSDIFHTENHQNEAHLLEVRLITFSKCTWQYLPTAESLQTARTLAFSLGGGRGPIRNKKRFYVWRPITTSPGPPPPGQSRCFWKLFCWGRLHSTCAHWEPLWIPSHQIKEALLGGFLCCKFVET